MQLVSMDLWGFMDESKEAPPSKCLSQGEEKNYHKYVRKTIFIITFNPADNQLLHIQSAQKPLEMWKIYCNIQKIGSLSKIRFINNKVFTFKLQEGNDLLDHISKVKTLGGIGEK